MRKGEVLGFAKLDRQGRITVPKGVRKLLSLTEGDQVFWKWKDGYVIFGKVELIIKEKPEEKG